MADDKETTENTEAPTQSGGKLKLIAISAVVLLLLVGAGVGAYLLLGDDTSDTDSEQADVTEKVEEVKTPAKYVAFKPMTLNYTVANRQRFVQITPSIMAREKDVISAIEDNMPLIRNNLLVLFGSQEFESLQGPEGQEQLRKKALAEVNKILKEEIGKDGAERVLFTGFIIQ